jgi:hypothetical protein
MHPMPAIMIARQLDIPTAQITIRATTKQQNNTLQKFPTALPTVGLHLKQDSESYERNEESRRQVVTLSKKTKLSKLIR